MKDTLQTIRKSATHFLSGTLLSRFSGMARDISMAYAFGTKPSIAAFMIAFRLANLLRRVFGEGAMQSAFVPEFEHLRQQSPERALSFFRDLIGCVALLLVGIVAVGMAVLGGWLYWGNWSESNREIALLTLIMLPGIPFICLYGLNMSFLQCEKKYFVASAAPIGFNLIWILAVLALAAAAPEDAMIGLSFAIVAACVFQWFCTVPQTYAVLKKSMDLSIFWKSFSIASKDLRRLWKPLGLGILGVSASQINNAIDPLFARFADDQGPALLWYAIRLQQIPIGLFAVAVAGAILPPLSRAFKAGRRTDFHGFLHHALSRTALIMIPFTGLFFVGGDLAVSLIYGRGDFATTSIVGTSECLWAYAAGLLPMSWILILAPTCYAQNHYRFPAWASFFSLLSNVFLNTLFIVYLGWGAMSVALATSLSAWMNAFFLCSKLTSQGIDLYEKSVLVNFINACVSTGFAGLATYSLRIYGLNLPIFGNNVLGLNQSFIQKIGLFSIPVIAFIGIFAVSFIAMGWFLRGDSKENLDDVKDVSH